MSDSDRFKGTGWAREESDVPNARQCEEMNERLRRINEEAEREAEADFVKAEAGLDKAEVSWIKAKAALDKAYRARYGNRAKAALAKAADRRNCAPYTIGDWRTARPPSYARPER